MNAEITKPDASRAAITGFHLSIQDAGSLRFLTQAFADHRAEAADMLKDNAFLLTEGAAALKKSREEIATLRAWQNGAYSSLIQAGALQGIATLRIAELERELEAVKQQLVRARDIRSVAQ